VSTVILQYFNKLVSISPPWYISAPLVGPLGRGPPKFKMQTGQTSTLAKFQPYPFRQTAKVISGHYHGGDNRIISLF